MTSRMTAAAGLAAAAVLLGACAREASPTWTLVVDEPPQRADGVRYASDRFAFRLDGRTPVVVTVFLDDVPIARGPGAPAGTVYVVEGFPAPDGDHVVTVGVTGPATWKSDPVAIRLDRLSPTLVAWAPAPDTWEAVLPDTPRLEARFSEPLAPERVRADAVRATDRNGAAIGVAPSLSEDGGTLRLDFPRSLALYETVTVALDGLEDLAGNPVRAPQQTWRQPRMWVELGLVPGPWPRRGDVRFAFTLHGGVSAERVELLRGDQVVASSEAPPFPLSWSSTGEPDGVFEFSARALRDGTWSESSTVTVRARDPEPEEEAAAREIGRAHV